MLKHSVVAAAAAAVLAAAAGSALAADPVKIGMVTTLSTGAGYLGDHVRKGFELALEQGGVADRVQLLVEDDGLEPANATQLTERMVERDGVKIMTGSIFSNVAMATIPKLVRNYDILYVSPNAGPAPLAGKGCHPRYFNTAYQNDNFAEVMGDYANKQGYKRVYLMAPNYQAGKDSVGGFKRMFKGEVAGEVYTKLGQTDYAAEIAELRDANPDAVYFFYPGGMGINFMKQFAQAGLADKVVALGPAFSFDDTLLDAVGDAALGFYNGSQWSPDLDNAANKTFVEGYKAKYNEYPTLYAAQGYDTANAIVAALKQTDWSTDDLDKLAAAMKKADFQAVRGDFKFGNNNHPIQDVYVRQVVKDDSGNITNRVSTKGFEDHVDAYAAECDMK
ncbi:ABC transporter substrate-binding protein [Caenispirillum bisanense]|uniref:Amino acid/amide ABC transporter substrate-binding protein, HAAT family n=1 Tax=Caenispirillum bisanense TaxID=414052 RepID=A0A286GRJ8_9PROT|nr:ABC transporter substrate-binding protein [Caenispirillum bisanense]SOD98163.1 amino acid/amide ABC transporter substrate-binding protein, HAAT family [Caenispirillum bisanense]